MIVFTQLRATVREIVADLADTSGKSNVVNVVTCVAWYVA